MGRNQSGNISKAVTEKLWIDYREASLRRKILENE